MTDKLIDYERLKAFSEGLKSKYALKKDMIEPQERKYLQLKTEELELTRILNIEILFEHLAFTICNNPQLNNAPSFNYIAEWCREYDYNYDLVLSSERYKKNGFCGEWQKQTIDAPSMCIKSHEGKQLTPEEVVTMCQNTNDNPLVWFDSELLAELKSTYTLSKTMVASYFKFVQKAKGKRLSSNDYTNVDKAKVDAIPDNPKYTDTTYDLSKYATKQEVPTKLSQLTNDENFKTEAEIQSMIEKASSLKKEVVTSLPTTGKDDVIYLVKDSKGKDNNNYLEYLWLNGKYELIGSTQVDLSGYAKQEDILASKIIDKYVLTKDFRTALNNDQDFLKAIKRDMFTLVIFDGSASDELVEQAGFESILYYKGSVCGICLVPSGSVVDETFVKQNKFSQGEAYITSSLMSDYNKVIQSQIGELQSSKNNYLDKNEDKAGMGDIDSQRGRGKYVDASLLNEVINGLVDDVIRHITPDFKTEEFTQQELEEAFR